MSFRGCMGPFGNSLKTILLLGLLTALLLWIGDTLAGPYGLIFAAFFVILFNGIAFWWSDKIVLKMYKTQELPANHRVTKMVKQLVAAANLPMPKVHIAPTQAPNAFATGRSPKHSAVVVTQGILNLLDDRELKGVLAHELSHIKHRDTLISTIAGLIAGVISYVASMAQWAAIFGGFGGDRDGNFFELLILALVTPIIALIIQMAISRTREYAADECAARMTGDAVGMKNALLKLERGTSEKPLRYSEATAATEHMFIINPFSGNAILEFLSTHPPTHKRVERLNSLRI